MTKQETIAEKPSQDVGTKQVGSEPASSMLPYYCSWYRTVFSCDKPSADPIGKPVEK